MNDHLSPAQAAAYPNRQLPPAERLALSDHLAACEACRASVAGNREQTASAPRVFAGLIAAAREADGPPPDEAWRGDTALPPCTPEELAERREFEATMAAFEPERFAPGDTLRAETAGTGRRRSVRSGSGGWWGWLTVPGALGLAAAVIVAVLLVRGGPGLPGRSGGHAAELVDGPLTIRTDGGLDGMLSLPAELRDAVLETVRRRAAPGALLGTVTRGDASTPETDAMPTGAEALAPESPVGVVESDRPVFRWNAEKSVGVQVSIQPSAGGDFILSGPLPPGSREWTAPRPFERGRLYRWQVVRSAGSATRPWSARFKVLPSEAHARLEALRAGPAGRSHLALGVAYAREGMHAQAREEFQRLENGNARSTLAQQLRTSAETWQ